MPQVIIHTKFLQTIFYEKQVLYLFVECPGDCSMKSLALGVIRALDAALGSDYYKYSKSRSNSSTSAVIDTMKALCIKYRVGLLVIDEIQNVIDSSSRNKQIRPLVKLLVELTNETATSVCFVGTSEAEDLFQSQQHLGRRTRGLRLAPMKPDKTYIDFMEKLWKCQATEEHSLLTKEILDVIYDYSAGIPAYIVKIFTKAQEWTLLSQVRTMNIVAIRKAIAMEQICPPRAFHGGTSLSDFEVGFTNTAQADDSDNDAVQVGYSEEMMTSRVYSNARGRKKSERHLFDLIVMHEKGDLFSQMYRCGLLEGCSIC